MRMGELGGAVSYLYWSERRIKNILEDNGLRLRQRSTKLTTPSIQGLAPVVEFTATANGGPPLRAEVAKLIEASLGRTIVSSLDSPTEIRYAQGTGSLVFGRFVGEDEAVDGDSLSALIFTSCDYGKIAENGVAVCLFGSMDNFIDFIKTSSPKSERGWTSSAAPNVIGFLRGRWTDDVDEPSREELAGEALKIAERQGIRGRRNDTWKAWRRGFTYGDVQNVAEWFAEIYLDVDLGTTGLNQLGGYRRILVGAPVWIRTPLLRAVRIYDEYSLDELEESVKARIEKPARLPAFMARLTTYMGGPREVQRKVGDG
jgi:hypothetical protein